MLRNAEGYKEVYQSFRWKIPRLYNIARGVCDKWAGDKYRLCLIYEDEQGNVAKYSFWEAKKLSNKLANALGGLGIGRTDRVGVLLGQQPETLISHLAIFKLGAVSMPLFTLFGPDSLEYRLRDSGAKAIITDSENVGKITSIQERLPELKHVICVAGQPDGGTLGLADLLDKSSARFSLQKTTAEDPAILVYTSGTTGPPKGALLAHRVMLGHLPGVEFPHNFFPRKGDLFWTPADWAWVGGLIDVLLPSLHHGIPVVAFRMRKFDPERGLHLIQRYGIRNAFIPPTALKMMREVPHPRQRFPELDIRTIASGGETLGEAVLMWGIEELGVTINEFYGQTEVNLVIGNCSEVMAVKPGSMGRPIPGHVVEVIDEEGRVLPSGQVGEIAVRSPDPVMFLGYWQKPRETQEKFVGNWWTMGDLAQKDDEGYFYFVGRKDDVISSAGYRIGPGEIEDCLLKHSAVALASVIGKPDEVRGEIVKAFIVPREGHEPTEALARGLQEFVKERLSAHLYPREVEFTDNLPLTATGKIMRGELRRLEVERTRSRTL
ncbi:MAG: Acetyl-coenzyme A synthetase [Syntrophomonadaceae bacterium]|nr:Acetyl-coenzyme A synthetase [Bacillota bacterium]MBT9146825.1 Acetyl-coenzyme A synthetase [Bacillota bacterium]